MALKPLFYWTKDVVMSRVFIIEMEVISPIGASLSSHMEKVKSGASGADYIKQFDVSSFPTTFGCEVTEDISYLRDYIHKDIQATFPFDRKPELFCSCAELLKLKADTILKRLTPERNGVFLGVGFDSLGLKVIEQGSHFDEHSGFKHLRDQNRKYPQNNAVLNPASLMCNYAASRLYAKGERVTNLSACAASSQAIGDAYKAIQEGRCDSAITGGVDSTINPFTLIAFTQLNMISTRNDKPQKASCPFDMRRDGFVPGEGAGILVLASEKEVDRLGVTPIAEITGYGSSLDGYKITAPHETGLGAELAMRRALNDAQWSPESIDYLNAHGTSTPLNDAIECMAIKRVFVNHIKDLKVSSTKSQIGHLIAAGGAVEAITVAGAMQAGFMPPSINVEKQDKICPVNLVKDVALEKPIKRALSNSFALAGQNCCLAFAAVE